MSLKYRGPFAFLMLALFASGAYFTWHRAWKAPEQGGLAKPFRRVLESNGAIWEKIFRSSALSHPHLPPPLGQAPRENGDVGLEDAIDPKTWRLTVIADEKDQGSKGISLSLDDLKKLPRTESSAEFRCIEGWSEPVAYAGVRFVDFMQYLGVGGLRGKTVSLAGGPPSLADLYPYVGLETPDGKYYVSIDMESMLHPQTVLAYEMNGISLPDENGAPLRLVIPVKYGIKNLKRVGKIFFSETRPHDYWAEQGYDWFAGL